MKSQEKRQGALQRGELDPGSGCNARQTPPIAENQFGTDCRDIKRMINDRVGADPRRIGWTSFTPEIQKGLRPP
jgi:hypothetical protein